MESCNNCGYEVNEVTSWGLCQTCQEAFDMGMEHATWLMEREKQNG